MASRESDMTSGVIWKQLIAFAVPLIGGLVFQQLYAIVDSIVVGRFVGKTALAAINSTGSITFMLVGISTGLSLGASVLVAQFFGAHDRLGLSDAVHSTIGVTFVAGVLATIIGILMVDPLLQLMDTPETVYEEAKTYLTIYFAGMLGSFVYNMGSGILRAVGDSKRPLYFLIFSAVVNTLLDLLFVVVFPWKVAGAALATIIAQFLSAVLILFVLSREKADYGLQWRKIRLKWSIISRVLSVGLPTAAQQLVTAFSNVFVQSYINFFGDTVMASWGCYSKLDGFLFIPLQALCMAVTTFVSQNYGAGKMQRARKGVNVSVVLTAAITMACAMVLTLAAVPMVGLFSEDAEVVEKGAYFVRLISPLYVTVTFAHLYAHALRGTGKSTLAMIAMLGGFVVSRQIYLYIVKQLCNTEMMVGLSYPFGWIVCSILMYLAYRTSPLFKQTITQKNIQEE